jgi:hypothetical protein
VEQLWAQACQTKITMAASKCRLLPLDFITTSAPTSDTTLHSDRQPARFAGLVARGQMLSPGPQITASTWVGEAGFPSWCSSGDRLGLTQSRRDHG